MASMTEEHIIAKLDELANRASDLFAQAVKIFQAQTDPQLSDIVTRMEYAGNAVEQMQHARLDSETGRAAVARMIDFMLELYEEAEHHVSNIAVGD